MIDKVSHGKAVSFSNFTMVCPMCGETVERSRKTAFCAIGEPVTVTTKEYCEHCHGYFMWETTTTMRAVAVVKGNK